MFAQPPAPTQTHDGCPTTALPWWATSQDPDWEQPMLEPNYRYCYNCESGICGALNWDCRTCMEIVTIEMVYNPNLGEYETVYMVRYDDNNIVRIYYTYKVVKVPIY